MGGTATGAMSYVRPLSHILSADGPQAFIAAMTKNSQQSYVQLLNSIRDELRGKFDQKPQLSASHRAFDSLLILQRQRRGGGARADPIAIDTNLLFIC